MEVKLFPNSRRPGLGSSWYDRFHAEVFPSDFVVINGTKRPIPDYYTRKLEEQRKLLVTSKRKLNTFKHAENNTPDRLAVREKVLVQKTEQLKRDYDNES